MAIASFVLALGVVGPGIASQTATDADIAANRALKEVRGLERKIGSLRGNARGLDDRYVRKLERRVQTLELRAQSLERNLQALEFRVQSLDRRR